jgi:uncharacterized membrane protein YgcG
LLLLIELAPHVKELMLFASPPVFSTATYMLVVCVEKVNVEVTPAGVFTWWKASEESGPGGGGGGGEREGGGGGGGGGGGEGHRPHEARQFVCARALTLHRLGFVAKWVHGTHVPSL